MEIEKKKLTGYIDDDRVVGKIILKATLTNTSPLLIGSGLSDIADKEIMRLPNRRPYIPASAVAGKLRRLFLTRQETIKETDIVFQQFWGVDTEKKSYQSHILFDNLEIEDANIRTTIRDGVRINHKTNLAEDKGKFDYELLEEGHKFGFSAEITIRNSFEKEVFIQMAAFILKLLCHENFRIGAHETSGFGEMKCTEANLYAFDFPTNADAWFKYVETGIRPSPTTIDIKISPKISPIFSINATFAIKTTFLTSTYGIKSDEPDKRQLGRKNADGSETFILSGKALRGTIRHRGLRILNTVGVSDADTKINQLFGNVDEKNKYAQKSKLRVKESEFKDGKENKVTEDEKKKMVITQTRIKIDRFTGGTISGALQEAQPLTKGQITLEIEIPNYTNRDAALLMFILKDLWTADLPIGGDKNIGRGVLQGVSGTVTMGIEEFDLGKLGQSDYQIPESFKNLSLEAWKQ